MDDPEVVLRRGVSLLGGASQPHFSASASSRCTPLPVMYIQPSTLCACACPCSAALLNHAAASARFLVTPCPQASALDLTIRDVKITEYDGRLEEVGPHMGKEDREISRIVSQYKQKVDSVLNVRIGDAEIDLDGENVRKKETNLGNFLADIMREVSKADATLINGGTIRTNLVKGEIRVKDVYSVLPFDNYIVAIRLTGKQIAEALEHGVAGIEAEEGWFPQVSGLTFKYSPTGAKGSRVREILIAGQRLDPAREYVVATNNSLAVGGDGYKAFADAVKSSGAFSSIGGMIQGERVVYSDSGRWLRDVVVEYIKERGKIAPRKEGRIMEVP